ncbi:ABC transporter permease [Pseudoruegeria sp. SK021]|uniref:ABC transporter permease n=1 Tax=Pseudoruegeria sp. SK021 TaxID=1933035 RepID=UPI000A236FEE|nr:ABC transporter permease [Pseudoruegeria sp. SK021]OSP54581.1 ABC transporter permease [Pseudoruegeria sp. SK021]
MSLLQKPWIWSWIGTLAVCLVIIGISGLGAGTQVLSAALSFGTFFVIVAIGQMFVVTLGPGNVDLSIPACMTLASTVAMKVMGGSSTMLLPGLLIAIAIGTIIGLLNFGLIRLLRIPPIIATLSSSFLFQSTAIWYNRGLRVKPPEPLADFATAKLAGVPLLAILVLVLTVIMHVILHHSLFGRAVLAVGQNSRAASLAGIKVERTRLLTYLTSAVLAAICGFFLAGFSGGAALNMGEEYLLMSIAVVVIGGTSVAGGFANLPGLWGASLFMFLLVTMLNTLGLSAGIRLILTGAIIVGVIAISGRRGRT